MGREMASITDHVIDQGGEKIPGRQLGVGAAAWVLQAFEAIANESEKMFELTKETANLIGMGSEASTPIITIMVKCKIYLKYFGSFPKRIAARASRRPR